MCAFQFDKMAMQLDNDKDPLIPKEKIVMKSITLVMHDETSL